jgi:hypothetical protein
MAVQVEHRKQLEGEVEAGVALFRGGASGASDSQATWQANLPSQSMVDNQWRLYLLCQEFEAGRLSRDAYCAASSGIWEAIVGQPIPVEGCSEDSRTGPAPTAPVMATPPQAVKAAAASVPGASGLVQPQSQPAALTASAAVSVPGTVGVGDRSSHPVDPAAGTGASFSARSSHWVLPSDARYDLDLWGPLTKKDGTDMWVLYNGACLSVLELDGGRMVEVMLLDRSSCSPWTSIDVDLRSSELLLTADGSQFLFRRAAGPPSRPLDGEWRGAFLGKLPPKVRPVRLEFSGPHAAVAWSNTGCSSTWVGEGAAEDGSFEYSERSNNPLLCPGGARVTVEAMSDDTVLMLWEYAGLAAVWGLAER